MAGAGTYNVGYGKDFGTIAEALAALVADQGVTPFSAEQRIVFHDSYLKENVVIPSSLVPTSSYKLVITTHNNRSSYWQTVNAYDTALIIQDLSYVRVENFLIAAPSVGISIKDSTDVIINGVEISGAYLSGVEISRSSRVLICNTAISEGRFGIELYSSKDIVIVYSRISSGLFTKIYGKVAGLALYASWDYNANTSDTPSQDNKVLYLFNSIITTSIGQYGCLSYTDGTEKFVEADGNIYGAASAIIGYLQSVVDSQSYNTFLDDLPALRIATGQDENSIVDNFKEASSLDGTTRSIDENGIHYGNLSDATKDYIAKGLKRTDISGRLPAWVDETIFDFDIDGDDRGDGDTTGPKAYTSGSDYDLFLDFVGNTSEQPESYESGVDRAIRAIDVSVTRITPEINDGFFYIRDNRYYLYANKACDYLEDMTWYIIELGDYHTVLGASLFETGNELAEHIAEFKQVGKKVYVCGNNVEMNNVIAYTTQVRLYLSKKEYDSHIEGIDETRYSEYYDLYKLDRKFFFRVDPVDGAPIVVTDDTIETSADQNIVPFVFTTEYSEELEKVELILEANKNKVIEPHFSGLKNWGTEGATYDSTSFGIMGNPYKVVSADTDIILQDFVYKNTDNDLMLSFYMNDKSRGKVKLKVTVYDLGGEIYNTEETSIGLLGTSVDAWRRYSFLGIREDDISADYSVISPDYDLGTFSIKVQDNEVAEVIKFELISEGSSTSEIDCLMATESNILEKYAGLSESITVEYESSEQRVRYEHPLGLSPIVNAQNSGFLAIRNLRAEIFGDYPAEASTINDESGSFRFELPWAKLGGPSKIHNLEEDFLYESPVNYKEIGSYEETSIPYLIETVPHQVYLSNTNKAKLSIKIRDQYNNPSKHEDVTCVLYNEYHKYPGMLCVRELSIPSKYDTEVEIETDTAGNIDLLVEAPDEDFYTPFTTSDIVGNMVLAEYPVSGLYYGNPRLYNPITGLYIDITGDTLLEDFTAPTVDQRRVVTLDSYPKVDSIEVRVSNTSDYDCLLQESQDINITKDEYYVDYSNKEVKYHKDRSEEVRVEYEKQLIYKTTYNYKDALYIEQELVDIISSDMIVLYNTEAEISISCKGVNKTIDVIILQNDI